MKRNPITLVTAGLLSVIFVMMLFAFQVRKTDIAVVTTFGRFSRAIAEPGLQWRLPWPVQKVYKFDNRIHNFERGKFEQITTRDAISVLVHVYAGWRVTDPRLFMESFNGDMTKAETALEPLVRNIKSTVIGRHPFSDLVSTNQSDLKFDLIEKEMLDGIQEQARSKYGIEIRFLGIKQLGLPESITAKVFERMRAERMTKVRQFQTDGEREGKIIRAQADSQANKILADARATAIEITGAAEAKANEHYRTFQQDPELANFLFSLRAMEQSLKERTTLILDQQTAPFNMLGAQAPLAAPAAASGRR